MVCLNCVDIDVLFCNNSRNMNDIANKKREKIFMDIINNNIPDGWYKKDNKWNIIRDKLLSFYKNIYGDYESINVKEKAGRKNSYDFTLEINGSNLYDWEWKYGASSISDCPQFVSPMKPSQYFNKSFEEYFYDNYLIKLCVEYGLEVPDREIYINGIHNDKPECVKDLQVLYYSGCKRSSKFTNDIDAINFYNQANRYSKEGISNFVGCAVLDVVKLEEYFKEKNQVNKNYVLYKNNDFYYDKLDEKHLTIVKDSLRVNKMKNGYVCKTESGSELNILLRWKNGNGIAFPAFQIKLIK